MEESVKVIITILLLLILAFLLAVKFKFSLDPVVENIKHKNKNIESKDLVEELKNGKGSSGSSSNHKIEELKNKEQVKKGEWIVSSKGKFSGESENDNPFLLEGECYLIYYECFTKETKADIDRCLSERINRCMEISD